MDETPITRRPWFYIVVWLVILLGLYGWQILRLGGVQASLLYILVDLACIFPILVLLWTAFFAQFVLPVRTASDRQRIVERLLTYLTGGHGPTLFIENGVIKEHSGERHKRGPGVVWLDAASAAVTRTAVKIRQTMGPGVHFMDNGEFIANTVAGTTGGTVDLHIQNHSVGPRETDKPFAPQNGMENSEYQQVQDRRKQVSAWTRDGIELVPNISVMFRVDTGFPKEGQPGSRFGYRTGITKKDKANEKADQEIIQKAILGEGINPNISSDQPRHRVAWNQLPAQLAVDVWREYAAKFTLDQLFKPDQPVPPALPPPPQIVEEEVDPLSQPLVPGPNRMENSVTAMLRVINKQLDRSIKWFDGTKKAAPPISLPPATTPPTPTSTEPQMKTAIQVITDMVKARLTQPEVDVFDDNGVRGIGQISSQEYKLLQSRGLKVLAVSIGNIRFDPSIDETIISRWSASWLRTAEEEKKQIERRLNIIQAAGQEQAIRQYAEKLSVDLLRKRPEGVPETIKTLVMRSRAITIENEELRKRLATEQETFEEIIKWMELNGK
jgi:hypothetical protein